MKVIDDHSHVVVIKISLTLMIADLIPAWNGFLYLYLFLIWEFGFVSSSVVP